jgi:hypothetical protein
MGTPCKPDRERITNPSIPLSVDSIYGVLKNASILPMALILTHPNIK